MKISLPSSSKDAVDQMGSLAALLDKNGWKAAAFIAVSVKPRAGQGTSARSGRSCVSFVQFAKALNAKGWSKTIIQRNYEGWEQAADAGIVPHAADLVYGERIDLPTEGWSRVLPAACWTGDEDAEAVAAAAKAAGTGASKAVDIAQNPKALAAAIKGSARVREAAAAALAGSVEETEIAAKVMANPKQAQVVLGDKAVEKSVSTARAANLNTKRTTSPTFKDSLPKKRGSRTLSALTLMQVTDDISLGLGRIGKMIDDLDDEARQILIDFLQDDVILIAQGYVDLLAGEGADFSVEDITG